MHNVSRTCAPLVKLRKPFYYFHSFIHTRTRNVPGQYSELRAIEFNPRTYICMCTSTVHTNIHVYMCIYTRYLYIPPVVARLREFPARLIFQLTSKLDGPSFAERNRNEAGSSAKGAQKKRCYCFLELRLPSKHSKRQSSTKISNIVRTRYKWMISADSESGL